MTIEAFRMPANPKFWATSGLVASRIGSGHLQGGLFTHDMRQFFGGLPVPVVGIASVMVVPEARGRGVGASLVGAALAEAVASGRCACVLYPSTIPFYRRLGFEVAGIRARYRSPIPSVRRLGRCQVEVWEDADLGEIASCYERFARHSNGLLDRCLRWWRDVVLDEGADRPVYRYALRQNGEVTGYVVCSHEASESEPGPAYVLSCRDLVWTNEESAMSVLGFLEGHRAFGRSVTWSGPVDDPFLSFFDQYEVEPLAPFYWMARIVDVRGALEARGYPRGIDATVALSVRDDLLATNTMAISLAVSGGRAQVCQLDAASLTLDIGALSALYTGWMRARDLHRLGRLHGATQLELELLEAVFGGSKPWLLDHF